MESLKLLVVEDSELILECITESVKDTPATMLVAKTKEEALRLLEEHSDIEVVLLDGDLGKGFEESFEILAAVKRTQKRVKFITSISADSDIRIKHVKEGATNQIEKYEVVQYIGLLLTQYLKGLNIDPTKTNH